jgi:hypothetical protein
MNRKINQWAVWGGVLVLSMLGLEMFKFFVTFGILSEILSGMSNGVLAAGSLAFVFCAFDIAGLARLFTEQQGKDEPAVIWLLTFGWLLASVLNASLIWMAVATSMANASFSTSLYTAGELAMFVPILVAATVWLVHVTLIGTISLAGDRLLYSRKAEVRKEKPAKEEAHDFSFRPTNNRVKEGIHG